MKDKLLSAAQNAVEMAQKAGAAHAFATSQHGREVEYSVRDGKIENVKEATSKGLSLRVWVDGRYGSHSTNDLRPAVLQQFVTDAIALTKSVQPDEHRSITDSALYADRSTVELDLFDPAVENLTRDDRIQLCMEQDSVLRSGEKVISATSGTSDSIGHSAMVSSNGFSGSQQTTSMWLGSEVTFTGEGDKKPATWMWGGARHRTATPSPADVANIALERGYAVLGSSKGPTQQGIMIVDPSIAAQLIRRLLRPATGRDISQNRSFWADKFGQLAVSPKLTLVDDPLIPRGLNSRHYDSEGISARSRPIIEEGVMEGLYIDTYYGSKLQRPPSSVNPSNLVVQTGTRDLAAIIADTPSAVYVTGWLGGNADNTTGDFSLGLRGHLIDQGEVGPPVSEMNITGDLLGLFSQLLEVGNDPWPYSSVQAPTLVFDQVSFSGS